MSPLRLLILSLRFFLPAAVLVLVATWLYGQAEIERELTNLRSQDSLNVGLGAGALSYTLKFVTDDINFLATHSALRHAMSARTPQALARLEEDFANFTRSMGFYDQLRWIDETGMEIVRIDLVAGQAVVAPAARLQNKGKRYYFTDSIKLNHGEVFVSPLDLNMEEDKIELPYKPTLRLATPVFGGRGQKRGIVILNYYGREILDVFAKTTTTIADHVMMVNGDGYWLKSANPGDEWGFMFNRTDLTLAKRSPEAWGRIRAADSGQETLADGIWTWQTVYPLLAGHKSSTGAAEALLSGRGEVEMKQYVWKTVAHLSSDTVSAIHHAVWLRLSGVAAFVLGLFGFGSWKLARAWLARAEAELEARRVNAGLESLVTERTQEFHGAVVTLEQELIRRRQVEEHLRKLSRVVEQSPVSVVITDLQGSIEYANPKFSELSGYPSEELIGANPRLIKSGQMPPETYEEMWAAILAGSEWHGEVLNRKKNGDLYWEDEVISPIIDAQGSVTHFVAVKEDITQRKRAEEELLRLNRTLKMSSECNQALVRATAETELLDTVCSRMTELGGYVGVWVGYAEHDEARTVRPVTRGGIADNEFAAALDHVSWADTETGRGPTGTAIRTGQAVVARDLHTDPRFEPWRELAIRLGVQSAASLPLKAGGRVLGALSMYAHASDAFDDREVKLLRELADDLAYGIMALRESAERQRAEDELLLDRRALESSNDGIMITDSSLPDRPLSYVNPAFERITGYTSAEAVGRSARFLLGADRDQIGLEELRVALREQRAAKVVIRNYRKDGSMFWNELSLAPVRGESGQVRHFISIVNDITERKSYETELEYQAGHDALTGLPNRNLLADRLDQAIAHALRDKRQVAVMLLDLDRFKLVNDGLGHTTGDALLKTVSQRLAACVRSVDTVARLGGDEFVVIMTDMESEHDAALLARKLLDQISQPMLLADRDLITNASMGIALYPKDAEHASELLKNADVAMYRAKELGRNGMQFYTPEMNARALARLELDTALRSAVEHDELILYYQPKVELQRGQVIGAEALIRWRHPLLGLMSPADFIPLAEETGLIVPIGEWVINTACAQLKAWRHEGFSDISLAVNLSARQFQQEDLAQVVAQALRLNELEARYLELEVTESAVMQDPEKTVATLRELKQIGVRLSLDDFGTGYSSLDYLKRFPIDILKIDQSFVGDITTDPDDAAIATTVIALAHSLKRRVVAEGVETEAQLKFLRRHHCDEMQGYYFSHPLPADEFARLLRDGPSLSLGTATETGGLRTLLLVDDEPNIISALQRVLRRDGYQILTATSAAEGLELLALNEVRVIVSDQRMPGMSGVEFLRRVKTLHPETVRLVLSGYTDLKAVTDAINEGAIYKFLTKPWDDGILRANIEEAFRNWEMTDENRNLHRTIEVANRDLAGVNEEMKLLLAHKDLQVRQGTVALDVAQEVLECLPWPIIGVDDENMIAFANAAAGTLCGGARLGMSMEEALPAALVAALRPSLMGEGEVGIAGKLYRWTGSPMGNSSRSRGNLIVLLPLA